MRKTIYISAALLLALGARAQGIDGVLRSIETNNLELRAHRSLTEARDIEARAANRLENPEVEYIRSWGVPSEAGVEGEMVAAQSFDFPTAYVRRARMASMLRSRYDSEHALLRQQTLLEAKLLCIDLVSLRRSLAVAAERERNAEAVAELYAARLDAGKGNILEKNRTDMELTAARSDRNMIEIEIEAALNRLSALNGGQPVEFADTVYPAGRPAPMAEMMAVYADEDPALAVAAAEVEVARQRVRVERAQTLPKIKLGYKLTHAPGQHFNGLVMGVSLPIFGYRSAKAARAEAAYAEAGQRSALNEQRTSLEALYDRAAVLVRSIEEYRDMERETGSYREYLSKAVEAGQISAIEYFSSLGSYYDVLGARIETERQLQEVYARIDAVLL